MTGTGTYAIGTAITGYLDPAGAGVTTGARLAYVVVDSLTAPTAFEIGEGSRSAISKKPGCQPSPPPAHPVRIESACRPMGQRFWRRPTGGEAEPGRWTLREDWTNKVVLGRLAATRNCRCR